jgi:hypothetical protein
MLATAAIRSAGARRGLLAAQAGWAILIQSIVATGG